MRSKDTSCTPGSEREKSTTGEDWCAGCVLRGTSSISQNNLQRGNIYTLPILFDSPTTFHIGRADILCPLYMRTLKLAEVKYLSGDIQLAGEGPRPLTPSPVLVHCIPQASSGGQRSSIKPMKTHLTHSYNCHCPAAPVGEIQLPENQ